MELLEKLGPLEKLGLLEKLVPLEKLGFLEKLGCPLRPRGPVDFALTAVTQVLQLDKRLDLLASWLCSNGGRYRLISEEAE